MEDFYARLFNRFAQPGPNSPYQMQSQDKHRAVQRGLLQMAAALAKPNGGNLTASIANGLLAGSNSVSDAQSQYGNDAYRADIMKRTQSEMAANTAKSQAWQHLYGADGNIDPNAEAALKQADPQGYLDNAYKLHPEAKPVRWSMGQVGDGSGGTIDVMYDPENPQATLRTIDGKPLGGGPQNAAAPAPQGGAPVVMGGALAGAGQPFYSDVESAIAPFGARITSTNGGQHNAGSLHPLGRAVDIGMGASATDAVRAQAPTMIAGLQSKGYTVRDERTRPAGQAVWGGPHLHVELPQSAAGPQMAMGGGIGTRPKAAPETTVSKRQQDIADFEAQGIKVSPSQRNQYLMTGKMPGEEGGAMPNDPLAGLDPATAALVKKISTYDALPSSLGRAGNRADLIGRAAMLNPDFNEADSQQAYTLKKDMGRSTPTSIGGQVTSINTAAHHLATLLKANEALNASGSNSRFPMVNRATNALSHGTGASAVNNWNQAKTFISEEFAKLIKGGVATEGEIDAIQKNLDASLSPRQRNDAIAQAAQFLQGRIGAIEEHRNAVLGDMAAGKPLMTDESRRVFEATQKLTAKPSGTQYMRGQIVEHGGKKYRVTGGDPTNPDLEEVR